jgi:hypothetical protein
LIGIKLELVEYGIDVATPLTGVMILISLILISILNLITVIDKKREYLIYRIFIFVVTVFFALLFVFDDNLKINL